MAGKIATRAAYGEALVELAEQYPELVVFDADLSNATMTKGFAAKYPERFFDMGIAECNMVGVAAGLAACGKIPVAATFAMFSAGRAFEQVRNSVGYPHLNVKVAGTHAGISVGEDGATHQCLEDLALMRSIPGMTVLCPADHYETMAAVRAMVQYEGPVYIRLGRLPVESVYHGGDHKFELGKGITLRQGTDVAIIATGMEVQEAVKAADLLAAEGVSAAVIDIHTIKPLDEQLVLEAARAAGAVVTAEEHSVIGGLGDAVADVLMGKGSCKFRKIGVNDQFGQSGKAADVLREYGLTADQIADRIRETL